MNEPTDSRPPDALRPWSIERAPYGVAPGRVVVRAGRTTVLCTASVEDAVPPWMKGLGKGWVTAEYNMLPGSTAPRKQRERGGKTDGRTTEIQRLIGRSLRAVVDMAAIGERTITVDCDVLEADGGTRTAAITGGFVALADALASLNGATSATRVLPLDSVAAVSAGIVAGRPTLDLDYRQDVGAEVDMNIVMTGGGRYVELQGTGEKTTFDADQLDALLRLARNGIVELTKLQTAVLSQRR